MAHRTARRSRRAGRLTVGQWMLGALHGPSQIYFQHNVITGALVLAAFFISEWRLGLLACLGAVGGMLGGRAVGFSPPNVAAGMQSFCGALVGAAVFTALGDAAPWSYALAFAGGLATAPLTWVIDRLFTTSALRRFDLPYTTAPFVIVAGIIAVCTTPLQVTPAISSVPADPVPAFLTSLLTSISQVILVDNAWSGGVILLGLFIAQWRVGLAALLGSFVGTTTAVVLGVPWAVVGHGVISYSGVLTAIALAVTFMEASACSWLYALPWTVVTAMVTLGMLRLHLAVFTWPYILTTWLALIVAFWVRGLTRASSSSL